MCLKRQLSFYWAALVNLSSKFPIVRGIEIVFYSSSIGIEVIGYLNDSLKSVLLPKMRPNACLSFFIADIALGFLFLFLIPRAICNIAVG